MRFFRNRRTDPCFNLALEECLARDFPEDFFMLWRNDRAVIVGRNQIAAAEIDADYVREHRIKVVRRVTGGGAVYHDPGNLNYTIGTSRRLLEPEAFRIHAAPVVRALRRLGVPAEFSGRNDLLVHGRKFSGAARGLFRHRTLFHGTLLFDTDLEALGRALHPDADKIKSKGVRSVRSRVIDLRECLPEHTMERFIREFGALMLNELGLREPDAIPGEFIARAERIAEEKYRRWDWNHGTAIPYDHQRRRRFPCGTVELRYGVRENGIRGMRIHGDFFSERPVEELAALLTGLPPDPDAIREALRNVDVGRYVQGLALEDFLGLFA